MNIHVPFTTKEEGKVIFSRLAIVEFYVHINNIDVHIGSFISISRKHYYRNRIFYLLQPLGKKKFTMPKQRVCLVILSMHTGGKEASVLQTLGIRSMPFIKQNTYLQLHRDLQIFGNLKVYVFLQNFSCKQNKFCFDNCILNTSK